MNKSLMFLTLLFTSLVSVELTTNAWHDRYGHWHPNHGHGWRNHHGYWR